MSIIADRAHLSVNPQMRFVLYAIVALVLTVLTIVFQYFLAIGGVAPDVLLILCVWVSLAEGQFAGMLFAFAVGMIADVASSDVLGSNALAKLLAAFVAGYFFSEKKVNENLGTVRFLVVVTAAGLLHNLIYYFLYIRPTEISFTGFFVKYGIASTLYTTVLAIVPMLWKSRNMER